MPQLQPQESSKGKAAVRDVYSFMRASILEGGIAPGERINIDAVSRRLGVSQTPVREVLQRLEGDNLVVYRPGHGYSTTPLLDLSELRALFEFRLLVEPWAARSAAVDRLANPAETLGRELETLRSGMQGAGDKRQSLVAHDARFHDAILAASGNKVVRHAFAQTHCHLHTFRLYPADANGSVTLTEHSSIRDAIHACNPEKAEAAMAEHIRNSFARFAQAFAGDAALAPPDSSGSARRHIV
jgi:DNA-binding GntR family transcriptional regulator